MTNFFRNQTFKLNDFVELVCVKFEKSKDYDTPMVLIDWVEHLHSIPSVNIIKFMPRFILKFLRVIECTENQLKEGANSSRVDPTLAVALGEFQD